MKLHRFYTGSDIELKQNFWLHEPKMLWQWNKVLRFRAGQQVVLFDGLKTERLYEITTISTKEAGLKNITEFKRKLPRRDLYLLWALLKKDKNDLVLQKGAELGVSHFVPLLTERTEKTGFDADRARKIAIEAAEQCGRGDIPAVREPLTIIAAINELKDKIQLFVAEQSDDTKELEIKNPVGVMVGPEGGWSNPEKELFKSNKLPHLNLHDFTLRAETACIAATSKLLQ